MIDERAIKLEELLTLAFNSLQESEKITESKIDIPFLLNIVGSYLTAKRDGKLDDEAREPKEIFEERILPIVDNSELTQEEIPDGEQLSTEPAKDKVPE